MQGMPYLSTKELQTLSASELADYIEGCDSEYDGLAQGPRVALVRTLRLGHFGALDTPEHQAVLGKIREWKMREETGDSMDGPGGPRG